MLCFTYHIKIHCTQKMHSLVFPHHSYIFLETIHEYISCRSRCTVIIHTGEEKKNISLYNTIFPKQQNNNIRFRIVAKDLFNLYTISSVPEALILKHFIIRKSVKKEKREEADALHNCNQILFKFEFSFSVFKYNYILKAYI